MTINLAPADLKKDGSALDSAIAVGILAASGQIEKGLDSSVAVLGELGLDGRLRPIDGVLPMLIALQEAGIQKIFVPEENKEEAGAIKQLEIFPVGYLSNIIRHINEEEKIERYISPRREYASFITEDFSEVQGQKTAKRALEIAAAGGHNVLMVGAPGSGKTMLAKRMSGILPPLNDEESLEVSKIYSVAGLMKGKGLIQNPPFCSPHHTASEVSLVGGGRVPRPGQVSLSHRGVLYLDELPEFDHSVLGTLRQPLEEGNIQVTRIHGSYNFPARFILTASMNPCPCGNLNNTLGEACKCTMNEVRRYQKKISGPLLDRIDLFVQVYSVPYQELVGASSKESTEKIRSRILEARILQKE